MTPDQLANQPKDLSGQGESLSPVPARILAIVAGPIHHRRWSLSW